MIDPDAREQHALNRAGDMGSEYLKELRKTDIKLFTGQEWLQFVRCIVGGYFDCSAEQEAARRRR